MLNQGDNAPDFELPNQHDEKVRLSDYRGKKLLLYFYPKANTPGCITQATSVRDSLGQLTELGVAALGISPDLPKKQKSFDDKHNLGFPLLSDPEHQVSASYDVWGEKTVCGKQCMGITRSSFLIDEEGKILKTWYNVKAKDTIPLLFKTVAPA
jgi:peroxiredoxin Q/BCP